MGLWRKLILGGAAALALAMPAVAAEKTIIVLDASGSMWAQVDGKSRIDIARETLRDVLKGVPPGLELGFMAYGHREKGNCGDIELLVEPGAGTSQAILDAADAITPKGKTPLSAAVRLAAEDLQYTEEKARVILITDGLETCNVDPCALGKELESKGVDFTADVVGFGLSAEEGKQVACLAENTGGRYFSASDAASLVKALTTTVAETVTAPEPKPAPAPKPVAPEFNLLPTVSLAEGGPDIKDEHYNIVWEWYGVNADGSRGEHVDTDYYSHFKGKLAPGHYLLDVTIGYVTSEQPITIEAGTVLEPHFVLNAAILKLRPRSKADVDVDKDASVVIKKGDETLLTTYGDVDLVVPAGSVVAEIAIGKAALSKTYVAAAGQIIDEDVIVAVGVVNFAADYVEGMAIEDDIYLEILDASKDLKGNRKSIAYGYGGKQKFELAPGDYVVDYSLDGAKGEISFSIKADTSLDIPLVIDAGVVAITTPGDDYVEILGAKKDITGKRVSFDYGYGPNFETTLKAGDYVIHSLDKDTPLTVPAGERTEVTIQ